MWNWLLGTPGQRGPRGATLFSKITFNWPAPLIAKGWRSTLDEGDATFLVPAEDEAAPRASAFEAQYAIAKVWVCVCV